MARTTVSYSYGARRLWHTSKNVCAPAKDGRERLVAGTPPPAAACVDCGWVAAAAARDGGADVDTGGAVCAACAAGGPAVAARGLAGDSNDGSSSASTAARCDAAEVVAAACSRPAVGVCPPTWEVGSGGRGACGCGCDRAEGAGAGAWGGSGGCAGRGASLSVWLPDATEVFTEVFMDRWARSSWRRCHCLVASLRRRPSDASWMDSRSDCSAAMLPAPTLPAYTEALALLPAGDPPWMDDGNDAGGPGRGGLSPPCARSPPATAPPPAALSSATCGDRNDGKSACSAAV